MTSEGDVRSNTTLIHVHSLAVSPKKPQKTNSLALPTAQAFSNLLLPLKAVVALEMLTMKAFGVLLFRVCMNLRKAAPSLKLGNLRA